MTIDLVTGNIIYHVSTKALNELRYDNVSHKLYALTNRPGATPSSNYILSICTVNPATGISTNISDLPAVTGISSGDHGTFNENEQVYFFTGIEQHPPVNLYSINATTGSIINQVPITTSGVITNDNLIYFRFDNTSGKLYGLLWEANTFHVPPVVIDSTCRLDIQTKIYANHISHSLILEKKVTTCKVKLTIYNLIGQLILKNKEVNDGHNEIKLGNLSSGIYYYNLISESKILLSGQFILH